MCAFHLCLAVDPSLGRVDYSLMSDQTLTEMLIEGFDAHSKKQYQDSEGMYLDVCEWSCVTCDDDQRVVKIDMDCTNVSGSLELCYTPPKVEVLRIVPLWMNGKLTGSVDLAHLPEAMQVLDLRADEIAGDIDLTKLPEAMVELHLGRNQLSGSVDLTHLPDGMQKLLLNNNQLTGEIDLTKLPDGTKRLYLQNNQFSGEVDLTCLPDNMTLLSLQNNKLTGSFVIMTLTNGMVINAQGNKFNAVAVVDSKVRARIKLFGSGVTSVVDENGKELDTKRFLA